MMKNYGTGMWALVVIGCGATPGAQPHDMSRAGHESAAAQQEQIAAEHGAQYDPSATELVERCAGARGRSGPPGSDFRTPACWTSVRNPTEEHRRAAEEHQRQAADHRAASAALRDAETVACAEIAPEDRDMSPFDHPEDIGGVAPLFDGGDTVGAQVTLRPVPGLSAEWLQAIVNCHAARNASLGHDVPEMPNCPLVPLGAQAVVRSAEDGSLVVDIRSDEPVAARDILDRAQRLVPAGAPDPAPSP